MRNEAIYYRKYSDGQMWSQCSRNCGHFKLKLKLLALTWALIHGEISPLGHAVEAVILKLELSHYERGEQLGWLWADWNCCLSWGQKLPFSGDFSGYYKSRLFEEHLEKAESKLLTEIKGKELISVHCCIHTELVRLMLLDFTVLYKIIELVRLENIFKIRVQPLT